MGATAAAAASEAWTLGIGEACGARRLIGEPRQAGSRESGVGRGIADGTRGGGTLPEGPPRGARVLLVAGIANPERFAEDVRAAGWTVVAEQWFADHHPFTAHDISRIAARAAESGAEAVFTTDKDAVRLEGFDLPFPLFRVPVAIEFDPPALLFERIDSLLPGRRDAGEVGGPPPAEAAADTPPAGDWL